jgi:hypothetical protein
MKEASLRAVGFESVWWDDSASVASGERSTVRLCGAFSCCHRQLLLRLAHSDPRVVWSLDRGEGCGAIEGRRCEEIERHALRGVYGAQELHEMVTDLGRGFVLYPVAHIFDFEIPHETGKAGAEFFHGWIEIFQAIRLPRNVKGGWAIFAPFQALDKQK